MARQVPPAQTPEGRRKTRNKIVAAILVLAAFAPWVLYPAEALKLFNWSSNEGGALSLFLA
jgi:hypothetical protein